MDRLIDSLEKLWERLKENPRKTIILIIIAALLVIASWFLKPYLGELGKQTAQPKKKVEFVNVFDEIDQRKDIIITRTFWLLRDREATTSLGPCPSEKCFKMELGELFQKDNLLFQKFILTGGVLSFFSKNVEEKVNDKVQKSFIFGCDDDFIIKNTQGMVSFSLKKEVLIDIALVKKAEIKIITKAYDIQFSVNDIRADSLKIIMNINHSSGRDNSGVNVRG